jgi:FKBP-type peptidyl-prolyl cis-trans isomerase
MSERTVMKTTLRPGTGAVPKPGFEVEIKYEGFLSDGTLFDSTACRGDAGLKFVLGNPGVITGLTYGACACAWLR